jgi:hypothetical protein
MNWKWLPDEGHGHIWGTVLEYDGTTEEVTKKRQHKCRMVCQIRAGVLPLPIRSVTHLTAAFGRFGVWLDCNKVVNAVGIVLYKEL